MARLKKEKTVTHRLPDDTRMLSAVGMIALRHGQLDNQLRMLIKDFTGVTKEEALDATRRDGSYQLRDRILKLARQRLGDGAPLVKLQALLTKAARVTERRNELLHGVWGTDFDSGALMIRDDNHAFRKAPSVKQLEKLGDAITAVLADIVDARMSGFLYEAFLKIQKPG